MKVFLKTVLAIGLVASSSLALAEGKFTYRQLLQGVDASPTFGMTTTEKQAHQEKLANIAMCAKEEKNTVNEVIVVEEPVIVEKNITETIVEEEVIYTLASDEWYHLAEGNLPSDLISLYSSQGRPSASYHYRVSVGGDSKFVEFVFNGEVIKTGYTTHMGSSSGWYTDASHITVAPPPGFSIGSYQSYGGVFLSSDAPSQNGRIYNFYIINDSPYDFTGNVEKQVESTIEVEEMIEVEKEIQVEKITENYDWCLSNGYETAN